MSNGNRLERERGTTWFSEIYESFFLRDLLSFIVPGVIVILGVTYVIRYDISGSSFLEALRAFKNSLIEIGGKLGEIASLSFAIVIFGVSYIFGFIIQELGVESRIIMHFNSKTIEDILDKKYGKNDRTEGQILREHYYIAQTYARFTNGSGQKTAERNIVLRQMIGNTLISIILVLVIKIVMLVKDCLSKSIDGFSLNGYIISAACILLIILLRKIYRVLLEREFQWRIQAINSNQGRNDFNDPSLWELK